MYFITDKDRGNSMSTIPEPTTRGAREINP
jgi:hypothetical protein